MTVEFIGMIQPRQQSEIHPARGPAIDPGYVRASAQAHDEATRPGAQPQPLRCEVLVA